MWMSKEAKNLTFLLYDGAFEHLISHHRVGHLLRGVAAKKNVHCWNCILNRRKKLTEETKNKIVTNGRNFP